MEGILSKGQGAVGLKGAGAPMQGQEGNWPDTAEGDKGGVPNNFCFLCKVRGKLMSESDGMACRVMGWHTSSKRIGTLDILESRNWKSGSASEVSGHQVRVVSKSEASSGSEPLLSRMHGRQRTGLARAGAQAGQGKGAYLD